MSRNIVKYLIVLVFCAALCVGAASALDDLVFYTAKQNLIKQYTGGGAPGGGTPGGGIPGKPTPGYVPSSYVYVGRLPFIVRAGDDLTLRIYGDLFEGQKLAIALENGGFSAPGGTFAFNISDVPVPADLEDVHLAVTAQPVSWLRLEDFFEDQLYSMESSSPDANGRITLQATKDEVGAEENDFIVIQGTPTVPQISLNYRIEGTLAENVSSPQIPFHIDKLQRGSFTIVVSIDGREKLREPIFIL
jgi:hypothetical protein